jgi:hypothetical protein
MLHYVLIQYVINSNEIYYRVAENDSSNKSLNILGFLYTEMILKILTMGLF